jgi:hypothetical protein
MDVDMGFGVRFSDALSGHMLMNLNPRNETGQDFRSRLNFKRGSLTMSTPGMKLYAFDSEPIADWDDPFHLVGSIGQYAHPFGYQRQGFQFTTPQLGFQTELLYTDNFEVGGTSFPGFTVSRAPLPDFVFTSDATAKALELLATERGTTGFRMRGQQAAKVSATDFGDDGKAFGYGDGNENTFAMRIGRDLGTGLHASVLGRTDRGFQLGRLSLAEPLSDSLVRVRSGMTTQQWYGLGGTLRWEPTSDLRLEAEALFGARRLNLVNGATDEQWKAGTIAATGGDGASSRRARRSPTASTSPPMPATSSTSAARGPSRRATSRFAPRSSARPIAIPRGCSRRSSRPACRGRSCARAQHRVPACAGG